MQLIHIFLNKFCPEFCSIRNCCGLKHCVVRFITQFPLKSIIFCCQYVDDDFNYYLKQRNSCELWQPFANGTNSQVVYFCFRCTQCVTTGSLSQRGCEFSFFSYCFIRKHDCGVWAPFQRYCSNCIIHCYNAHNQCVHSYAWIVQCKNPT